MALTLLTGGARSGKSDLAVRLAAAEDAPVVFIATAEAIDDDMSARIARHQRDRPADWALVEEPRDLASAITAAPDGTTVILDCLTLWVANLMHDSVPAGDIEARARAASDLAKARSGLSVVVTNEVGSGIHPPTELGRAYADTLGRVNVIWSRAAHRASLVVAGRVVPLG